MYNKCDWDEEIEFMKVLTLTYTPHESHYTNLHSAGSSFKLLFSRFSFLSFTSFPISGGSWCRLLDPSSNSCSEALKFITCSGITVSPQCCMDSLTIAHTTAWSHISFGMVVFLSTSRVLVCIMISSG